MILDDFDYEILEEIVEYIIEKYPYTAKELVRIISKIKSKE